MDFFTEEEFKDFCEKLKSDLDILALVEEEGNFDAINNLSNEELKNKLLEVFEKSEQGLSSDEELTKDYEDAIRESLSIDKMTDSQFTAFLNDDNFSDYFEDYFLNSQFGR